MRTGIIQHLDIADYHADHAVSKSGLKLLLEKTPAHYNYAYRNPSAKKPKASKEKIFGQALHDIVLEPAIFAARYVEAPSINKNTTVFKEWKKVQDKLGRVILDAEDFDTLHEMHAKLHVDEEAAALLPANNSDAMVETSFFWTDPETDVRCKCRPDILLPQKKMVVPDLKTCRSVAREDFTWDILNYGYHIQDASYVTGLNILMPDQVESFPFICIEKEPPYCVMIYRLTPAYKKLGYAEYRRALSIVAACEQNNVWPEYPRDNPDIDPPNRIMRDRNLTNNTENEDETDYPQVA